MGNYEEGWLLYEWRHKVIKHLVRHFDQPLLSLGNEDLKDKTVLVYSEQGLGDTVQMFRYVPLLAAQGFRIILEVPATLFSLARELPGVAGITLQGEVLPKFDLQCSFMSLPLLFKTSLQSIPHDVPYLKAPENKINIWKSRLGVKTQPRIGLVWSGNETHTNDRNRSIPLTTLLPLLDRNAEFHSIQKEYRDVDHEILISEARLRDHSREIIDFGDTAALLEEMDLVISVDTAVAHLAGALGKPVWILLPYAPDFRWLQHREDSPWYPTAQLFRQTTFNAWNNVVENLNTIFKQRIT